jgi:hypothetical protein
MTHLTQVCHPSNLDPAALINEWTAALNKLGPATPNAGNPAFLPIPPADLPHIAALRAAPWLRDVFNSDWQNATFHLVEVDPLLAYQITVSHNRTAAHLRGLSTPPTISEMMPLCLPLIESTDTVNSSQIDAKVTNSARSIILKPINLNFRIHNQGLFPITTPHGGTMNVFGIHIGWSLPQVHVVRFNGRCYLHNGFHRAVGLRMAGATHIPCLLRDVGTADDVGIKTDGSTFDIGLLESPNPPTLAHYTQGRAQNVSLKALTRIIQINWSDHVMVDD